MKINYKIVWLDDKPKSMSPIIKEIESVLIENFFMPDIQEPYTSYEDFHNSFQNATDADIYGEVFNDCDLLLIDYNIASTHENEDNTGASLITELRAKGIYTEAVFYSDAMDEYRSKDKRPELDNVIYADKNELIGKVEKIVKRNVVQSMIISNLRGYLMDCTSDFDFICRTASVFYFAKLTDVQQIEILKNAEFYIHEQYKSENSKFKKINSKYNGVVDWTKITDNDVFTKIIDLDTRIKKLTLALDSQESVMRVRDKFRLLAQILQMSGIEGASEIYCADTAGCEEQDSYNNAIIENRNKLAHSKLSYGKCKDKIKIMKSLEDDCTIPNYDCVNNSCDNSYTLKQCKELREKIYKYYKLFNSISIQIQANT